MRLWSDSFTDGGIIAPQCAFAVIDPASHVRLSNNCNPHLAWDDVPHGTRSLVLVCHDPDAPAVGTDVNQEGRELAENLPRANFYHWILADIPPSISAIAEGKFSAQVTPHGKSGPQVQLVEDGVPYDMRHGINDYTGWFAGDPAMAGDYYGYDGPCPPWNDLRPHTYLFTLYALDVARLDIDGRFTGPDALAAIRGHILDEARIVGVYSLHPAVAAALGA